MGIFAHKKPVNIILILQAVWTVKVERRVSTFLRGGKKKKKIESVIM